MMSNSMNQPTKPEELKQDNWNFPDDLLEFAWIIIANANDGDWEKASPEWQRAAIRWRDGYFDTLAHATPEPQTASTAGEELRQQVYDIFNEHSRHMTCKAPCPGVEAVMALFATHQKTAEDAAREAREKLEALESKVRVGHFKPCGICGQRSHHHTCDQMLDAALANLSTPEEVKE